jgi:hypothetical protein
MFGCLAVVTIVSLAATSVPAAAIAAESARAQQLRAGVMTKDRR